MSQPALLPQVYVHFDPLTERQRLLLRKPRRLARERMDFLLLLPGGVRIVIEVDGKHHYARDLRPGDKLSVLRGSAQAVVREADPAEEDGWMSVLLDVSWDGPTLISSDTILSVRRPEPDPQPDTTGAQDDGPLTTVTVELTVTETVTYDFQSEVELPADVVDDENELHSYLDEREELWLDDLDPTGKNGALCITERTLDEARVAGVGGKS